MDLVRLWFVGRTSCHTHTIKEGGLVDRSHTHIIMEGTALPRAFNPTVSLPPAVDAYTRRYTQNAVNNRSFNPSETVIIQVPTGRPGAFLVPQLSYLRYTVTVPISTVALGAASAGDRSKFAGLAGAANMIGEQRVLLNGSVVEEILNHQPAYELFHDAGCGVRQNMEEQLMGAYPVVNDFNFDAIAAGPPIVLTRYNNHLVSALYESGWNCSAASAGGGAAVTDAWTQTFCVPIMSSLLGTFAEKALPTCLIAPNSLELHIRLSDAARAIAVTQTYGAAGTAYVPNWSVSNVQFVGCEVVLPSPVMDSILSVVPEGLTLFSSTLHNYTASTGAATSPQIVLGTNYASVNSLFAIFQIPADLVGNKQSNRRVKPTALVTDVITAQLQIGSERVPQVPTSDSSQIMAELQQAFGTLSDRDAAPSAVFGYTPFNSITTTMTSSFAIGYDLDVFSIASDQVRSGRNLVGQQTTLSLTNIVAANRTVQSYVWHDCKFVLRAGGAVSCYW